MTTRKCIYTNQDARAKDTVLPKDILGDESHNWAAKVPCDADYLIQKQDRLPTELELQAHEYFHLLELARIRVKYFEAKLAEVQKEILKDYKPPVKTGPTKSEKIKEQQIQKAIVQNEVLDKETAKNVDEFFENKRKIWEEE